MTTTIRDRNAARRQRTGVGDLHLATGELAEPERFPRLWNMSAGHMFDVLPKPDIASPEEYVYVPLKGTTGDARLAMEVFICQWNVAWEAAQLRSALFPREEAPSIIQKIVDIAPDEANIVFLPETDIRYREYSPLYHLIDADVLRKEKLPLLLGGLWPELGLRDGLEEDVLPADFEARLGRAFARAVWPRLGAGGRLSDFSDSDSVRLIAHNMDFWLPAVHSILHAILESLPRGPFGSTEDPEVVDRVRRAQQTLPSGVTAVTPRVGSDFWRGEAEAGEILDWVVEEADADGRLRAAIDAIKSHRVHDDFSPRWSSAREDFERKLNHRRAKTKVSFIELPDTIPVQAAYTDVEDRMVFGDFTALLDTKERQIVVLLWSGVTGLSEIAGVLGYKNHSPVSKRLERIRAKAQRFFDLA